LPSRYKSAGLPKMRDPVRAVEKTNKSSMAIGAKKVAFLPIFISVPKYIKLPTAPTYKAVPIAFKKAVFKTLFIVLFITSH